jgi:hypothetical protein
MQENYEQSNCSKRHSGKAAEPTSTRRKMAISLVERGRHTRRMLTLLSVSFMVLTTSALLIE